MCPADGGSHTVLGYNFVLPPGRLLGSPWRRWQQWYRRAAQTLLVVGERHGGLVANMTRALAHLTTVRQHVLRVAERAEAEPPKGRRSFMDGGPADWQALQSRADASWPASMAAMPASGPGGRATSTSACYASRTRFIPDGLLNLFNKTAWPVIASGSAGVRGPSQGVRVDVGARMRGMWR